MTHPRHPRWLASRARPAIFVIGRHAAFVGASLLGAAGLATGTGCDTASETQPGAGGSGEGGSGATMTTTNAGGGGATSSSGGSGGDGGGPIGPDKVPMFVAQGHMGMTAVSCDDGQTWIGYRTFETEASPLLCGETTSVDCFNGACSFLDGDGVCQQVASNCDCDHNPGSGKGLAYGDGAFVATFGWGPPGVVLRSTNGFDWTEVDAGNTFADVVAGDGYIALSARSPMFSTDAGLTFTEGTDAEHNPWNVRRLFYFAQAGTFMQTAASGDNRDLRLTPDWMSWTSPTTLPAGCESVSEAVEGGNVIVTATRDTYVCTSTDGADTFTRVELPNAPSLFSGPIWDGNQFIAWGTQDGHKAYTSPDGQQWTETATNLTSNDRFGEVARDPASGTMVAARAVWQGWYEEQRWYRSGDGITWETLAPEDGILSHPVRELTFGLADPSEACPLP